MERDFHAKSKRNLISSIKLKKKTRFKFRNLAILDGTKATNLLKMIGI